MPPDRCGLLHERRRLTRTAGRLDSVGGTSTAPSVCEAGGLSDVVLSLSTG